MIDYQDALALSQTGRRSSYDDTQTILYALSVCMGTHERELPFVFEGASLRAVPTMAAVLSRANLVTPLELDMDRVLHGEQRMTLHRPLPPAGALISEGRIVEIIDKGPGKGALIYIEATIRQEGSLDALVTLGTTIFARGDGGFGGPSRSVPHPHPIPERPPDYRHVTQTGAAQALLYRLNGDRNRLHADPELAKRAGFKAPILHGLCSYGIACRAVLASVCDYDPAQIASFDVRFTSPVFSGEAITTEIWVDGDVVSFRSLVEERGVVSINNGKCMVRRGCCQSG